MTLRCPACGARSRTGDARCDYCQARLATISCPSCFALLFEGSAYCPHCGTAQNRGEPVEARQARCPACRRSMRWITVGDLDLLECEGCDGTWIEADTFERLCASRETQAAVLHGSAARQPVTTAPQPTRYRPCLRCGTMMNRMNFGRRSGTVRRRLPRARHVPGSRRAAPGDSVRPRGRARTRPQGGNRRTARRAAPSSIPAADIPSDRTGRRRLRVGRALVPRLLARAHRKSVGRTS